MPTAYFGNSVNDTISVNLNNELAGRVLNPRALDATKTNFLLPLTSYPIKANKDKGVLGAAGAMNKVTIQFTGLADEARYSIQIDNTVTGQDLYFYIFENTLVGQDQAGRSSGITIKDITPQPTAKSSAKSKAKK
jgi:hypothetical protein